MSLQSESGHYNPDNDDVPTVDHDNIQHGTLLTIPIDSSTDQDTPMDQALEDGDTEIEHPQESINVGHNNTDDEQNTGVEVENAEYPEQENAGVDDLENTGRDTHENISPRLRPRGPRGNPTHLLGRGFEEISCSLLHGCQQRRV
jgi:hypothetical protein